jgi:hypothetical protein
MHVAHGGVEIAVPQQVLQFMDRQAVLQLVGGVGMALIPRSE